MGKGKKKNKIQTRGLVYSAGSYFDELCTAEYTPLTKIPEVVACARKIAELLGSATIYLMENAADGDRRIVNELSRTIDIAPAPTMTRSTWIEGIVMTLLLYGKGNAVVVPHTNNGYLESLETIAASRVSFLAQGNSDYKVLIDGGQFNHEDLLHFVYNPDQYHLWQGQGVTAAAADVLDNLVQGRKTEKAFMSSEYKPSLIVRVDANVDEFSSATGRQKIIDSYLKPAAKGEPWLIPGDMFDVTQVKPLSLADLAISDSMTINKKMIAAMFGVPGFIVGVGEYNRQEWNTFIQTKIMTLAKSIAAELTRKLIISPKWYLMFNVWSLMDYDIKTVSDVLLSGSDRGFVNGDEWRDRMNLSPAGLKDYRVLENYIPWDMAGNQSKLKGGES